MADEFARPIAAAWVSDGTTGARNYDELSSYDEIADVIRARPSSMLAVDMPHCAPADRAAGRSFFDALPDAPVRLQRLKDEGRFAHETDVVVPYRIASGDHASYGVWLMVSTEEISTSADDPGRVIRNEDVFPEKVRERVALTEALGHLVSAVLLVQTSGGDALTDALREWCDRHEPAGRDVDDHGQVHEVWVMGPSAERDRLLDIVNTSAMIVADGNHRSLAAQQAQLPAFLAVVTASESVVIRPYNRLLRDLGISVDELLDRFAAAGCTVGQLDRPAAIPAAGGQVEVYAGGRSYAVRLPEAHGSVVDRMDHSVVERVLLADALGLAPDDERIAYIGGDYGPEWLRAEVDAGRAVAAVLIAPVSTDEFVRVNEERMRMPRKSTWFTPKARAGLVLAEL
ncbi:MAG: DUF1015 family protein [Frankiaceae bacterium]